MFETVPTSNGFEFKIKAVAAACVVTRFVTVEENGRVVDDVFLPESKGAHECLGLGGIGLCIWQFVRLRIDTGVKSVFLAVEPAHSLIDRDGIWRPTWYRL